MDRIESAGLDPRLVVLSAGTTVLPNQPEIEHDTPSGAPSAIPPIRPLPAQLDYALPSRVGVGVCSALRYRDETQNDPEVTVSVFVPMPSAELKGTLLNLNAMRFDQCLPDRCILGDGGRTRAFIGVDKRPGTPLDAWLQAIIKRIPRTDGRIDRETALVWMRFNATKLIGFTPGAATNDTSAELPWDREIVQSEHDMEAFRKAGTLEYGALPLPTGTERTVVPLERYLELGQGYCIQRAILVHILLERIGIRSRIVAGAVMNNGSSSGHTWVELEDGRVLDPSWELKAPKGAREGGPTRGFKFGDSYRFEDGWFVYWRG
jgi:hypothetical protein